MHIYIGIDIAADNHQQQTQMSSKTMGKFTKNIGIANNTQARNLFPSEKEFRMKKRNHEATLFVFEV